MVEEQPEPLPMDPPQESEQPESPVLLGWDETVANAEAAAIAYTDEQAPLVAGRLVPRNMDRPPTVEDGDGLIAGTGWNEYDPVTNDLVQMWRWDGTAWQALDMSAEMIPVLDIGSATVGDLTGGRINVQDGPIVAGDPAGARVELTGDGLHAYDASGTETARIQGEGGEFVGGSFRTSDTLPGQVTLSDTAAQGKPGIAVEPEDATGYDVLPSIGPDATSMHIRGGVAVDGSLAGASFDPTGSSIYHNGPGETGTGSWALVNGSEARLAYRDDRTNAAYESGMWVRPSSAQLYREDAQGVGYASAGIGHVGLDYYPSGGSSGAHSRIRASTTDVVVSRRNLAGVRRALRVDDTGVWVDFNTGPFTDTLVSHNLLPTVTTSPFTMPAGWEPDGANVAKYTITGGACWWAGVIKSTGTVASGWTTLGYAPEDAWPKDGDQLRTLPTTSGRTVLGKISAADGRIEIWIDQSATGVFMHFSPFTYLV